MSGTAVTPYVVAVGSLAYGFRLFGPFLTRADADNFARGVREQAMTAAEVMEFNRYTEGPGKVIALRGDFHVGFAVTGMYGDAAGALLAAGEGPVFWTGKMKPVNMRKRAVTKRRTQ